MFSPLRFLLALAVWAACSAPLPAQAFDTASGIGHAGASYMLTDQLIRSGKTKDDAMITALLVCFMADVLYRPSDPVAGFGGSILGAVAASHLRLEYQVKF